MKNTALFLSLFLLVLNFVVWQFSTNFANLTSSQIRLLSIIVILIFITFLYWAKKKPLTNSPFITILLLAGMLLCIAYLSATPYWVRNHDIGGHLDYIKYIVHHHSLPSTNDCQECHQPPLYYLIVSPICNFFSCESNSLILIQIISLLFSFGFLVFGIKLLRLYLPARINDKYFNLAAALLIFWPSGIIHSVRIGNDALLYFLTAAGLYFITLWFINGRPKDLGLSLVFMVASLLTKYNGIILFGIIILTLLLKFIIKSENKKEILKIGVLISFLFFFAFVLINFKFVLRDETTGLATILAGNFESAPSALKVGNKIENFTKFDLQRFLNFPYANPWSNEWGKQYFFNYLLKSSLFGESVFPQNVLKKQAILISYLFVFLILIIIIGMIIAILDFVGFLKKTSKGREISPHILIPFVVLLFLMALIFFRYLVPLSCNNDFRYIYPSIIPFSAAIAYGIYGLKNKIRGKFLKFCWGVAKLGEITVYLFIISSILFFVSLVIL